MLLWEIFGYELFYIKVFKDVKGIILCYEGFNNGLKL